MRKKVLLIDESVTIHKIVELTVDRQHFELLNAYNVSEALTIASDEAPSLVLIDNKLFAETPEETILEFRDGNPNVGIVLLVGAYEQLVDQELEHTIVDDYIVKPFSSGTLNQVLMDILAKKGEVIDQPTSNTEIIDGIAALDIPPGDIQDSQSSPVHININPQEHTDMPDLGPITIQAENVNINIDSPVNVKESSAPMEQTIEQIDELPSLDDLPQFDDPEAANIIDATLGDNEPDITESIDLSNENIHISEDIDKKLNENIDPDLSNEDPETLEMLKMMETAEDPAEELALPDEAALELEEEPITEEDLAFAEQLAKDISDGDLPEEDLPAGLIEGEDEENNSKDLEKDSDLNSVEPSSGYDFEAMEKILAEEPQEESPVTDEAASPMSEMLDIIDEAIESGNDEPIDMNQMDDLIDEMDINPMAPAEPLDIKVEDIQEADEYNLSPDTSFADVENVMGPTDVDNPDDNTLISDAITDEMTEELSDMDMSDLVPATNEQVEEAFNPDEPDLFTEFQSNNSDNEEVYESTGFGNPNEETLDGKEERQELMSLFNELNLSYENEEQENTPVTAKDAASNPAHINDSDYAAKLVIELSKSDLVKLLENSVNKELLEKIMKEVLQDSISEAVEKLVPTLAEKLVREELKLIKGE